MKTKEKLNNSRSPEMPIYCKWDFFLLKKVVHLEFFENSLGKRIFMLKSVLRYSFCSNMLWLDLDYLFSLQFPPLGNLFFPGLSSSVSFVNIKV